MKNKKEKKQSLEKLNEKAELLKQRIQADTEELEKLQTEIKITSYDELEDELKKLGMSFNEVASLAKLKEKMSELHFDFDDIDVLLNGLAEPEEEKQEIKTEDEKK